MKLPDTFTPLILGGYFKGWDTYKGESESRWYNAGNISSVFCYDDGIVYAEIGFDYEKRYAVGRFSDMDAAKAGMLKFVARLGGLDELPDEVTAQLVALEP